MSLKIYGLARVVKRSKVTTKNNKVYVKITLADIKSQDNKEVIESICFKKVDQKEKLKNIKPNSIIYIDGKLELSPLRIVSSSFYTLEVEANKKFVESNAINNKMIAFALKKAQNNININKK